MDELKRKLEEFFKNRYGTDHLSVFMSIAGLILVFGASSFSAVEISSFMSLTGLVLLVLSALRVLSTNVQQRRKENDFFLSIFGKKSSSNRTGFSYEKSDRREEQERRQREKDAKRQQKRMLKEKLKTHSLFYCPNCKCKCFVPKGKGKVRITCPKCGEKFIGKT